MIKLLEILCAVAAIFAVVTLVMALGYLPERSLLGGEPACIDIVSPHHTGCDR